MLLNKYHPSLRIMEKQRIRQQLLMSSVIFLRISESFNLHDMGNKMQFLFKRYTFSHLPCISIIITTETEIKFIIQSQK
jgi:hypothetical protein